MKSKQACGWSCRLRVLPILFLLLGCAFVVYGASRGEVQTVLGKAVRICLECVGIGEVTCGESALRDKSSWKESARIYH